MDGAVAPHEMLPGTEGDSDSQNVPPSRSSTFMNSKRLSTNDKYTIRESYNSNSL